MKRPNKTNNVFKNLLTILEHSNREIIERLERIERRLRND